MCLPLLHLLLVVIVKKNLEVLIFTSQLQQMSFSQLIRKVVKITRENNNPVKHNVLQG